MRTVGFVGLGTMGAPMARNILRSGISVRVYDESRDARGAFADTRAVVCSTLPETYQGCESIVLMLPTIKEVETVLLGDTRALSEANPGCVIVNMSTVSPLENEKIASELHSRGLRFVEAPVARGSDNAHDGTLLIMAAGHTSAVEAVRPVLDTMGETIVCGAIGAASAMKLVNNYLALLSNVVTAEALSLARAYDLDEQFALDVMANTAVGQGYARVVYPKKVLAGDVTAGFPIELALKDLRLATTDGKRLGVAMLSGDVADAIYSAAIDDGRGRQDATAIYQMMSSLND